MVFGFDDAVLGSKPYRAAVMATWKSLKERRQSTRPAPSRPQPVSMLFEQDAMIAAQSGVQTGKTLLMIVKYNFTAERQDELSCVEGEALVCCALASDEWIDKWLVAKPIGRLGGPGLVPIEFLTVISRAGKPCESAEEVVKELKGAGVPDTVEWKKQRAHYRDTVISL